MSQTEGVTLTGSLERIIYQQPESGFVIGEFLIERSTVPITIKGTLIQVKEHETLQIKGKWGNHPVYGEQFFVEEYTPVLPTSLIGIEKYLCSKEMKGIGEKTAKRIVKQFGTDTFKIIQETPERLLEVPKFSKTQLKAIKEVWGEQEEVREVMTFLQGIQISHAYAQKIFRHYGLNSIPITQNNPYQLTEIPGIGFKLADGIARNMGFDLHSPQRAKAGLLYMLDQLASHGHTCYPKAALIEKTTNDLLITSSLVEEALQSTLREKTLFTESMQFWDQQADKSQELIFRPNFYYAEQRIADNVYRLLYTKELSPIPNEEEYIQEIEKQFSLTLDAVQKTAIHSALHNKVLVITGGPGTGKTTIVRFILALIRSKLPAVALAAPTGRAAKRMSEATQYPASTIHRLLGASQQGFQKNRENPLEYDLLIVDESSMIDTLLMDSFLEAIPSHARLIFVGDVDQLPSIGAGAILQNFIESESLPVVRLETIFRQASNSLITFNAHKIRQGEYAEILRPHSEQLLDFYFIENHDPASIANTIVTMITERIPQRFGFNPFTQVQVLTPMHKGITGSIHLNQTLQQALNPQKKGIVFRNHSFLEGDKVMQQKNNYDKEVFNGDIGIIREIDASTKELLIEFDYGVVPYDGKELEQLSLAYAISIHKSQGSEYPAVIIPLTSHHYVMLQRNLLYTAVTRGKELVIIIGSEQALQMAIHNSSPSFRYTGLTARLKE